MLLIIVLGLNFLISALCNHQTPLSPLQNERPNIIFFLTDDQDVHLDSLAYQPFVQRHLIDQGLRFTRHFCTVALCLPSRVNLWTGKAAHNTNVTDVNPPYGKRWWNTSYQLPHLESVNLCIRIGGYPKFISQGLNSQYLPVWLQEAGYQTFYTGKLFNAHTVENYNAPFAAGWTGSDFLLDPYTYSYLNSTWQRNQDPPVSHEGDYTTDVLARKAKEFLRDAVKTDRPFFLTIAPVWESFKIEVRCLNLRMFSNLLKSAPHSNVDVNGGNLVDPGADFTVTPPVAAARHQHLFTNKKIPRTDHFNPEKVRHDQSRL